MADAATAAAAEVEIVDAAAHIVTLRGMRVMLSHDLATLYGVPTKALVQSMRRNMERFPADFVFQLTAEEFEGLRSQVVTSNRGGARYRPYAFTEQGVAMLSTVLRSERAIAVSIEIMRTFVKLRTMLESDKELARQLKTLERKYDDQFRVVFDAIRDLMTPPAAPPASKAKRIGFIQD